jgi:CPA2 family monovalent cation:H+ antiporter-2
LVRRGQRQLTPSLETRLEAGDVVVLFGSPDDLQRAERVLFG